MKPDNTPAMFSYAPGVGPNLKYTSIASAFSKEAGFRDHFQSFLGNIYSLLTNHPMIVFVARPWMLALCWRATGV